MSEFAVTQPVNSFRGSNLDSFDMRKNYDLGHVVRRVPDSTASPASILRRVGYISARVSLAKQSLLFHNISRFGAVELSIYCVFVRVNFSSLESLSFFTPVASNRKVAAVFPDAVRKAKESPPQISRRICRDKNNTVEAGRPVYKKRLLFRAALRHIRSS